MKILKSIILAILIGISCISCEKTLIIINQNSCNHGLSGYINNKGEYAITFSNYTTKASVNSSSGIGYDTFNLYGWNSLNDTIMNPYIVNYSNGWTYEGIQGQTTQYFNNTADNYSFVGVISDKTPVLKSGAVKIDGIETFSVDGNVDTPKEFLYTQNVVTNTDYANGVSLNFKHGNAKVILKFTSDNPSTTILDLIPGNSSSNNSTPVTRPEAQSMAAYGTLSNTGFRIEQYYFVCGADTPAGQAVLSCKDACNSIYNYFTASTGGTTTSSVWVPNGSNQYYSYNGNTETLVTTATNATYGTNNSMNVYKNILKSYYETKNMKAVRIERVSNYLKTATDGVFEDAAVIWFELATNIPSETISTSGVSGIKLIPATSTLGNGTDAVATSYPYTANVSITPTNIVYTTASTNSSLSFTIPSGTIGSTPIESPTVYYTIPTGTVSYGMTVKLSYIYNNTTVYDTRVWIPASECTWEAGKIYTYTISINGVGNGKSAIADVDINDPTIPSPPVQSSVSVVNVNISDYETGSNYIHTI